MSAHGPVFLTAHDPVSRRWQVRTMLPNRWLLLAAATLAVVPADEGPAWTTAVAILAVAVTVSAVLALRRAAAKVDTLLAEELGPRRPPG
ncbi:hypothetical protein ABZ342_39735 [Amycolatopsis sp. NPDC005961]|uniref:hypothetical protein n=1 Tax=Amycolatopsis sp. NPDC005961 TaxID=3156720 RepID=UPI0033E3E7BE